MCTYKCKVFTHTGQPTIKNNLHLDESSGLLFTVHRSMGSIAASENTIEFVRRVTHSLLTKNEKVWDGEFLAGFSTEHKQ